MWGNRRQPATLSTSSEERSVADSHDMKILHAASSDITWMINKTHSLMIIFIATHCWDSILSIIIFISILCRSNSHFVDIGHYRSLNKMVKKYSPIVHRWTELCWTVPRWCSLQRIPPTRHLVVWWECSHWSPTFLHHRTSSPARRLGARRPKHYYERSKYRQLDNTQNLSRIQKETMINVLSRIIDYFFFHFYSSRWLSPN